LDVSKYFIKTEEESLEETLVKSSATVGAR